MAGKRQATSDLNHDNWDREEEPEERGTFRTATEEELKNRVIKKAKRKIAPGTGNDAADGGSGTKSIFSDFSGFGKQPAAGATAASSAFSFLSKIPAVAAATTGVVSSSTTTSSATPTFSFGCSSATAPITAKSVESSFGRSEVSIVSPAAKASTTGDSQSCPEYYKKLSSLNQAVCEWIKTHVDKNPVCILTPIFKDYEKYLEEIESEKKSETTSLKATDIPKISFTNDTGSFKFSVSNTVSTNSAGATSTTCETAPKTNGFSFALKKQEDTPSTKSSTTSGFSFGLKSPTTTSTTMTTTSTSNFSFGNTSNNPNQSTLSKPFTFSSGGTPFSFGGVKPQDVACTSTGDDLTEEEEPPKNEFKQVVEDDAVYSKKCKVFVKKDGNFVDKGVGTLYLKPVESSGKTQLLVRADTNLGNVLVNLILNSAIPAQRMGKNNVMMVCLPTPDVEKPTSLLLRVKTSEEADELLENIDKCKK